MIGSKPIRLSEICTTGSGGTPSRAQSDRYYEGGTIPWIKSGELRETVINSAEEYVTEAALNESSIKMVPSGAILLAMYGATVGRLGILGIESATNQAVCHIIPDPRIAETRYVYHALTSKVPSLISMGVGGAQPNINQGIIKSLTIPLPAKTEQRRIAAILDQADALRAKRREALAQLDSLTQSIFIEMFGDPAKNPYRWPLIPLGAIASKFSDGPFGSNLKSEHYVDSGVRVVRLQNIGVNAFVDSDKAYVSERHFETIQKHECRPGDVLVGTMGDPNLRACVLPEEIPLAINKADCVQIRVKLSVANADFLCGLLNHSSTLLLAQKLMHGQTRVRINMGGLRELDVPIPPISLQHTFSDRIKSVEDLKTAQRSSLNELDKLFASLQHRAFAGEL